MKREGFTKSLRGTLFTAFSGRNADVSGDAGGDVAGMLLAIGGPGKTKSGIDLTAAAKELGVTRRTVERWVTTANEKSKLTGANLAKVVTKSRQAATTQKGRRAAGARGRGSGGHGGASRIPGGGRGTLPRSRRGGKGVPAQSQYQPGRGSGCGPSHVRGLHPRRRQRFRVVDGGLRRRQLRRRVGARQYRQPPDRGLIPVSGAWPEHGPRWTTHQLAVAMAVRFGVTHTGAPDTAAAARNLGVSRRTVQRWLHGSGRARARIPAHRLTQITSPDPQVLRQEALNATYAHAAIDRLSLPHEKGIEESWRTQRWLEPHLVAILEVRIAEVGRVRVCQISVTRGTDRSMKALRRRGQIVDFTVVPTRFHATVLAHELLEQVRPWRLLPKTGFVAVGRSTTWNAAAPLPDLGQVAGTHHLR